MEYKILRELVQNHSKYEGCVKVARAPLIHDGFPGTFNLSFTEYPWLKEYGGFVDFDHDYVFSTVQSCIRPNDFPLLHTVDSWKYLGVFEIADLTGAVSLSKKPDYNELQKWQIRELIDFLKKVGIEQDRVHPSYCVGGTVKELTGGRYSFDFLVPKDEISRKAFLEAGVPEKNLIPDRSRDTFLSLHLHRPSPWGYRTEVNVTLGDCNKDELLDIATTEYIPWRPIYTGSDNSKENIIGLEESESGFAISAVGLERLCMAINAFPTVRDVDYISQIYDGYGVIDEAQDELAVESLRALHRIYADVISYGCKPGRHRKEKIRKMLSNIPDFDKEKLRELLKIHSQTQPWHPELREGIEPTIEKIEMYRAQKNNRSHAA